MIDPEERALMEQTVRGALADAVAAADADADAVLRSLDWLEMLVEQPDDAIAIVFGALGATNATATALDDVMTMGLGREPRADLAAVLPPFAGWDAPARVGDDAVVVNGLTTARAARVREILVACDVGVIALPIVDVRLDRVHGVDPACGLYAIRARSAAPTAEDLAPLDPAAWSAALALCRRAVGHQIAGSCRAMLELARRHALERSQFGRPIARFQAVRHRLAEALVAVEALEGALQAAREQPGPETASLAKALAGRTARSVARHCQQVLAGVGFTTEHEFHRFLKRTMVLEGLFGSADAIVLDEGRRLLANRRVPTLIEL